MSALASIRSLMVAFAVLLSTLLLSVGMVAVYARLIDPGHPPERYHAAATWIAPWASHIGGPILFFWLSHRDADRHPQANAIAFAAASIGSYVIIDVLSVPLFGLSFWSVLTMTFIVSLAVKGAAALAGALAGSRWSATARMRATDRS